MLERKNVQSKSLLRKSLKSGHRMCPEEGFDLMLSKLEENGRIEMVIKGKRTNVKLKT